MDEDVIALGIPYAGIAMIVFIVWFASRGKQARVQARTDLHKHLLDKFASGTELAQFLETEGGRQMIEDLGTDHVSPKDRALKHIRVGFILLFLGIGFLAATYEKSDLVIPGAVCIALGIGFLIGAFVSMRLSKGWEAENELSQPDGQTGAGSQGLGGSSIG